ncbi:hypothetical protein GCM10009759_55150 [Kitasatospora saccharophila]|uniref:Tail tube protein n=1 Tax=Kitasatospora saccharophila TaxID=407973 RepID=A0ABN2XIT4_9ACTN
MPLSHVSKLFSIVDCKITPLLTDPAGGTATYAAQSIDVPGIRVLTVAGSVQAKTLRGDNKLLDSNSYVDGVTASAEHAKLSLDVLAAILGGTVMDSGTTPAQKSTLGITGANAVLPYFKIEGVTPPGGSDALGGDVHLVLYKCQLSKFPDLGFQGDDYRIPKFEVNCVPLASTDKWFDYVFNETAVPIP